MSIDLTQGTVSGSVAGVSTPTFYSQTNTKSECSYMAELTANFQSLTRCLYDWHHGGCVNFPMCGRRMLRIDMFLGDVRNGFMFNVGDSPSNNGWGKLNDIFKTILFVLRCISLSFSNRLLYN